VLSAISEQFFLSRFTLMPSTAFSVIVDVLDMLDDITVGYSFALSAF